MGEDNIGSLLGERGIGCRCQGTRLTRTLDPNVDTLLLQFQVPKLLAYQAVCDVLEQDGRLMEAIQCFQKARNDLREDTSTHTVWEVGETIQGNVSRSVLNILHRLSTSLYGKAGKFGRYSDGLSRTRRGRQTLF